ncbi:hypothetical protein OG225_43270 (plasmid) [Nocardia sp. NBC_01377]|uniref:hypothetical protein n=1 Tax=Nocardia sp. NBC_01377 TaxID=2903595 RepID=UPI002F91700A
MDIQQRVLATIDNNPAVLPDVVADFERRWRNDPRDVETRRIYFALRTILEQRFPIDQYRPDHVETPTEAEDDQDHPFWTTDPFTIWDSRYRALARQLGGDTAAHIHVHTNKGLPDPPQDQQS